MKEVFVTGKTLPEAYHEALEELIAFGIETPCPDWDTTQRELAMTMVVEQPLCEPMISRCFIGGFRELEQYRQEMLDGILDFEIERGNWTYTYHDRMVNYHGINQVEFVIDELKRNPYSRRAVIVVRDVEVDAGNTDPACLQHLQYFVHEGKLDCVAMFRSNDACKATFMNAFALIMLQKRIADALGVEVGTYTHRANRFHCYEKDLALLHGYVHRILSNEDMTYDYADEWELMMEDEKPAIEAAVRVLKGEANDA